MRGPKPKSSIKQESAHSCDTNWEQVQNRKRLTQHTWWKEVRVSTVTQTQRAGKNRSVLTLMEEPPAPVLLPF